MRWLKKEANDGGTVKCLSYFPFRAFHFLIASASDSWLSFQTTSFEPQCGHTLVPYFHCLLQLPQKSTASFAAMVLPSRF